MASFEKMVDRLVADDMDTILNQGYDDYLYNLLLTGFQGYDNMTEEELKHELGARDIDMEEV